MTTKVEAIQRVLAENGGTATWDIIYANIACYYPTAKDSKEWMAGIRGVLYREIRLDRTFKKIGLGIFALKDYAEETAPTGRDKVTMHHFIEGVCLELGNFGQFLTYTADRSAIFRDHIQLANLASLKEVPNFTYPEIVEETKRIDVIWFNAKGLRFPQKVFEIVDTVGTLSGAFNRSLQLLNFKTEFYIVAPEQHRHKFERMVKLEPYLNRQQRFKFVSYDKLLDLYKNAARVHELTNELF